MKPELNPKDRRASLRRVKKFIDDCRFLDQIFRKQLKDDKQKAFIDKKTTKTMKERAMVESTHIADFLFSDIFCKMSEEGIANLRDTVFLFINCKHYKKFEQPTDFNLLRDVMYEKYSKHLKERFFDDVNMNFIFLTFLYKESCENKKNLN